MHTKGESQGKHPRTMKHDARKIAMLLSVHLVEGVLHRWMGAGQAAGEPGQRLQKAGGWVEELWAPRDLWPIGRKEIVTLIANFPSRC